VPRKTVSAKEDSECIHHSALTSTVVCIKKFANFLPYVLVCSCRASVHVTIVNHYVHKVMQQLTYVHEW